MDDVEDGDCDFHTRTGASPNANKTPAWNETIYPLTKQLTKNPASYSTSNGEIGLCNHQKKSNSQTVHNGLAFFILHGLTDQSQPISFRSNAWSEELHLSETYMPKMYIILYIIIGSIVRIFMLEMHIFVSVFGRSLIHKIYIVEPDPFAPLR